jgi:hypothetical protein
MTSRPADAIANHLARRHILTSAEQRRLDLDGDGRLTSRDLLIARSKNKPHALPQIVPEARRLRPGDPLICTMHGACPDDLRAVIMWNGETLSPALTVRRAKRRCALELTLPDLPDRADAADNPVALTVRFVAPGTIARDVSVSVGHIETARRSEDNA